MATAPSPLDVKSGLLFPFPFLLLGGGFMLAGIGILGSYPLVSLILLPVGLFMVTSFEGTEIDTRTRTYREYTSYLFVKRGHVKSFDGIEGIYVKSSKVSQTMYTAHTTSSSTFTDTEYRAYIRFYGGEKVLLFTGKSKKKMLTKAKRIAHSLSTSLQDSTARMPNE